MKKYFRSVALALTLLLLTPAALGEKYEMDEQFVRYVSTGEEKLITPATAGFHAAALAAAGTTPEIYAASMTSRGERFRIRTADGDEIAFTVEPLAEALTGYDAFDHGGDGQAALIQWTQENWPEAEVRAADFSSYFIQTEQTETAQGLSVTTRRLLTAHYGLLYTLSTEAYGQGMLADQRRAQDQAAQSLLFLGDGVAAEAAETTVYPAVTLPQDSAEKARVTISADATPLTVDAPPETIYRKYATVTGTTTPNTDMRYYIGDAGYARFTSDENGAYTVEITGLAAGRNRVRIQAIGASGYGTAAFTVMVKQVNCPVAVSATTDETSEDHYRLLGRTVPGASVKLYLRKEATVVPVAADGTFAVDIPLEKDGKYSYTLRAVCEGYTRTDVKLTLRRSASAKQQTAAVPAGEAPTDALLAAPAAGTQVRIKGTVKALLCPDGQPVVVIAPEGLTGLAAVRTATLAPYHVGQEAALSCTLTGEIVSVDQLGPCAIAE